MRVRVHGKAKDRKAPFRFQALREDANCLMPVGSSTLYRRPGKSTSGSTSPDKAESKKDYQQCTSPQLKQEHKLVLSFLFVTTVLTIYMTIACVCPEYESVLESLSVLGFFCPEVEYPSVQGKVSSIWSF